MNNNQQQFISALGKKIAEIRKARGLSQEELADLVEVHRTYIGFIEQGVRNPSIGSVYKISKALKVKVKELF